ncbi:MAG: YlbF family regulator [Lachnospiraceae bacterium]|nr:YlbF family regulator [Lachnospiraceae bacterium]
MTDLTDLSKHVVDIFKSTVEYNDYKNLLDKMKENGEIYERVKEFRRKNFLIQQSDSGDYIDLMDALTNEYEDVISLELVNDFIEAEAAFCKLVQDFNANVTEELEFDI